MKIVQWRLKNLLYNNFLWSANEMEKVWKSRQETVSAHIAGTALFTTLPLFTTPEPPTGTSPFLGSEGLGIAGIAPVWSPIPADVRPTRPQFIRHLPSPSALGNCSGSFRDETNGARRDWEERRAKAERRVRARS